MRLVAKWETRNEGHITPAFALQVPSLQIRVFSYLCEGYVYPSVRTASKVESMQILARHFDWNKKEMPKFYYLLHDFWTVLLNLWLV